LRDTMATWYYQTAVNDLAVAPDEAAVRAGRMTRDKNRTPMQWSDQPNAGFCPADVTPWLPINPNYATGVNVRDQQRNPDSLLSFYRRLIQVRRLVPALVLGEYRPLLETSDGYVAFLRSTEAHTVLVVLNYSNTRQDLRCDVLGKQTARVRFSSGRNSGDLNLAAINMEPYQILIAELI
jgi:alpha-glucosidase